MMIDNDILTNTTFIKYQDKIVNLVIQIVNSYIYIICEFNKNMFLRCLLLPFF